jgi:hypothetical protein
MLKKPPFFVMFMLRLAPPALRFAAPFFFEPPFFLTFLLLLLLQL